MQVFMNWRKFAEQHGASDVSFPVANGCMVWKPVHGKFEFVCNIAQFIHFCIYKAFGAENVDDGIG